jgi:hypothetical protein
MMIAEKDSSLICIVYCFRDLTSLSSTCIGLYVLRQADQDRTAPAEIQHTLAASVHA